MKKVLIIGAYGFIGRASRFMDMWTPAWVIRNIIKRLLRKDVLLARFFSEHQVDILSHAGFAVSHTGLPFLCWIPDLFRIFIYPTSFGPIKITGRLLRRCGH